MASDNISSHEYGLIIVGNSGVGKSFLANVLLGEEAFQHEFSARSVTHRTEFREITIGSYRYAIFNIPGLIEADQVSFSSMYSLIVSILFDLSLSL